MSGTKASVTYDVLDDRGNYRESRMWSHENDGWKMLHYSRMFLPEAEAETTTEAETVG